MIIVEAYNPRWATWFQELRAAIWPTVSDVALALEHVGSTSVPGLAAKPIIDLDIIVRDEDAMRVVIERLAGLGYEHRGDLDIVGREVFRAPVGPIPHHLYACLEGSMSLRNHLILRDYLRQSAQAREAYAELKRGLAAAFPNSIDDYIDGKTAFVTGILAHQMPSGEVEAIAQANRKPSSS